MALQASDIKKFSIDKASLLLAIQEEMENVKDESYINDLSDAYRDVTNATLLEFKDLNEELELNNMSVQLKLSPLMDKWLSGIEFDEGYPLNLDVFKPLLALQEHLELLEYFNSFLENKDIVSMDYEDYEGYEALEPILEPRYSLSIKEMLHFLALLFLCNGDSLKPELYSTFLNERIFWISGFAQHVSVKVEKYFGNFPHDFEATIKLTMKKDSLSVQCMGIQAKELSTLMEEKFKEKKMVPGVGFVNFNRHNKKIQ